MKLLYILTKGNKGEHIHISEKKRADAFFYRKTIPSEQGAPDIHTLANICLRDNKAGTRMI